MITDIPCRGNTVSTRITLKVDSEKSIIYNGGLRYEETKKEQCKRTNCNNHKQIRERNPKGREAVH